MNYLKHIYITLILTALASCGSETDEPAPVGPQTPISFGNSVTAIETEDGAGSRAAVTGKEDMLSFCVYGAMYEYQNWNWNFSTYMISDEKVIPAKKDDSWVTENLYYWPDESKALIFFAFSPDTVEGLTVLNPEDEPYKIQFMYEPPSEPMKQVDLLISDSGLHSYDAINYGSEPGKKVPLTFYHRLIQVNFEVRGNTAGLATITLKNVYKKGIFHLLDKRWDYINDSNKSSYTIDVPADGKFNDNHRLMIIPQVTPHDCSLEISFRDGSPSRSIPFGGKFGNESGKAYRIVITV